MASKTAAIFAYLALSALSAAAYGVFAFFVVYKTLAGEVMLSAYIWNIAFIAALLAADKIANDILLSKELVITGKNYFAAMLAHALSFVSFKTTLYLFYTFVLVVSRVSLLDPALIPGRFRDFALSIEYCLILLVVFDKFIEHLLRDDRRVARIAAKFARFSRLASAGRRGKGGAARPGG